MSPAACSSKSKEAKQRLRRGQAKGGEECLVVIMLSNEHIDVDDDVIRVVFYVIVIFNIYLL